MVGVARNPGDLGALDEREQEALGKRQDVLKGAYHQLPDPGVPQERRHLRVQRGQAQRHHDVGPGVLDLPGELVLRREGAVVDDGPAGLEDPEVGNHELGAVGQEQAHLHSLADAEPLKPGGGAGDHVAEGGIGVGPSEEVHAFVGRVALDRVVQDREQRPFGNLGIPGDVFRVRAEPRMLVAHLLRPPRWPRKMGAADPSAPLARLATCGWTGLGAERRQCGCEGADRVEARYRPGRRGRYRALACPQCMCRSLC